MNYLWDDDRDWSGVERDVAAQQIVMRDYQGEAVDAAYRELETVRSTLICLPTGTGKSVCFSEAIRRWNDYGIRRMTGRKVLLVAHRKELIHQAVGHATRAGLSSGVEMSWRYARPNDSVVVSSIQTLCSRASCKACRGAECEVCGGTGRVRRFTRFSRDEFGLIVIDEAHHAPAKSYRSVLAWFEKSKCLMVTATPQRTDKIGMHNVCDSTAYSMSLRDAIDLGWLVPIRQKYITVDGLNLEDVDIVNGDLANDQRERAYLGDSDEREQALLHGVAKPLIDELVGDRQAILFSPGQEHAAKITAALNSYPGVYAACVIDSTIPSERDRIVEDYKLGAIKILVNCMVFSEGFDAPKTSVIANCRSTKSKSLIAQFIGRGTRPLPGVVDGPTTPEGRKEAIAKSEKPSCLVLDFVGSAKVRLASAVDLLAGEDVDPIDIEEAIRVSRESGEFDPREALSRAQQSRKEREAKSKKVLVTRTRAASAEYSADEIDLDDDRENDEIDAYYVTRIRPTRITRAQLNLLARLGYDRSAAKKLTKKGASKAISRALAVARNKAQSRYQQQFHSATTIGELHQIGGQIKRAIECGDAVYRDVAFQQRLRNAFTARAKEIKGVQ